MLHIVQRAARRVVRETTRAFDRRHREWTRRREAVDSDFDRKHGVDTGGYTYLNKLHIEAENWRDGNSYVGVDPAEFRAAMAAAGDVSHLTFIDLGSGKGRAIMLAADYSFQGFIGVEFAESLVDTAKRNLSGYEVELIHGDATAYELPNVPTLLFLYNPFGRTTMDAVARRTRNSIDSNPRALTVVYLNPFHLEAWTDVGFKIDDRASNFAILRM